MEFQRYSSTAIIIHWLMAVMIISMICLGIYMVDLPKDSDERSWFFSLHKSIGLTLALLATIRLACRMISKPPSLPSYIPVAKRKLANATHHLLYLLMFIQPVSGYISSSFSGYKTRFWGVPLPYWGWKAPDLNKLFTLIHDISAICLVALILLHIAGVIYHIQKKQNEVFRRMWFS